MYMARFIALSSEGNDMMLQDGWHPWFAWWPTRLENGSLVWLKTIERKGRNFYEADGDVILWEFREGP